MFKSKPFTLQGLNLLFTRGRNLQWKIMSTTRLNFNIPFRQEIIQKDNQNALLPPFAYKMHSNLGEEILKRNTKNKMYTSTLKEGKKNLYPYTYTHENTDASVGNN